MQHQNTDRQTDRQTLRQIVTTCVCVCVVIYQSYRAPRHRTSRSVEPRGRTHELSRSRRDCTVRCPCLPTLYADIDTHTHTQIRTHIDTQTRVDERYTVSRLIGP